MNRIVTPPARRIRSRQSIEKNKRGAAPEPPDRATSSSATALGIGAIQCLLDELASVLRGVDDRQFVAAPVGVIAASIGQHVRHSLDHVAAFLAGAASGEFDYDQRERGTAIERDRAAALTAVAELRSRLDGLRDLDAARPVRVRALVLADGGTVCGDSCLAREAAFVVSHTVHHNALLRAICEMLGVSTPARFGYAPATLAFLDANACAPSQS